MNKILFCLSFILLGSTSRGQNLENLLALQPENTFDNVYVKSLSSDSLASSFLIWIKKEVALHKHLHHSEHVYVLAGMGEMILGDVVFLLKSGDMIFIPKNTPHSVKVTSQIPLKVLSVQAPNFDGKDRIILNE